MGQEEGGPTAHAKQEETPAKEVLQINALYARATSFESETASGILSSCTRKQKYVKHNRDHLHHERD